MSTLFCQGDCTFPRPDEKNLPVAFAFSSSQVSRGRKGARLVEWPASMRLLTLRQAERLTGIWRYTLKSWLQQAGVRFPGRRRGSKFLVREQDIRDVIELHSAQRSSAKLRS